MVYFLELTFIYASVFVNKYNDPLVWTLSGSGAWLAEQLVKQKLVELNRTLRFKEIDATTL